MWMAVLHLPFSLTLKMLGIRVKVYIPDRMTEGYGVNRNAVQTIIDRGAKC